MVDSQMVYHRRYLISLVALVCTGFLQAQEPADTNYDESKVPTYTLPPLLPKETAASTNAERAKLWTSARRAEIQSLLEKHVYGQTPDDSVTVDGKLVESSDEALGGSATRQQFTLTISPTSGTSSRSLQIDVLVYAPKGKAQAPAFIGLNFYGNQTVSSDPNILISKKWMRGNGKIGIVANRATEKTRGAYQSRWQVETLIKRGYGLVTAYCGDIDPDNYQHDFTDGAHPLFYKEGQAQPADNEWGTIGAWAWGLSTVRNWLDTQSGIAIDAKRLAVIGHSRLGKTALWAGAQDENFAMVISNNSG
ncbi:MAG: acetylxylan esterase, partial [Verrucomicrobiales bacterium]|nr:acetylxylan esterase [Verrucomicrobiales bacterium]